MYCDSLQPLILSLQPIPSKLKYYNNTEEENKEKRDEDRETWQNISDTLRYILRSAAGIAKERGLITAEREHAYHISGTIAHYFLILQCPLIIYTLRMNFITNLSRIM